MRRSEVVLIIAILLFLGVWLWNEVLPSVGSKRPARLTRCGNNLRQVVLSILNYREAEGEFPPRVVFDGEGNPQHSWRVLILPYLEHSNLFSEYDLSEAWDGSNKSRLADHMPSLYRCPSDTDSSTATSYVALTGFLSPWNGYVPTKGEESVPIVIEIRSSHFHWMKPVDLDVSDLLNPIVRALVFDNHQRLANVGFSDGSIAIVDEQELIELVGKLIEQ